jgi:hypothetical protein
MEDDLERHSVRSLPPEIISSHLDSLSRSGLHVNLTYKLVICLECSQALDHSHIHGHVSQHRLPCPSTDELATILDELDLLAPPPFSSSSVIAPIVGLELVDGFVCLAKSCGIAVGSKTSFRRHRDECHMGATASSEPCQIHRIFGFKGHQLVVRVDPNLAIERPHGTLAEYMSVMRPKEDRSLLPLNPSDDPRKTTGFLQRSRWLQVVSGHSTQDLLSLVAIPAHGDELFPIMPVVKNMFKRMWDDVESMEVLPRRHIHTPKGLVGFRTLYGRFSFVPLAISTLLNLRINHSDALKLKNTCLDVQIAGACIYAPFFVRCISLRRFLLSRPDNLNIVTFSVMP